MLTSNMVFSSPKFVQLLWLGFCLFCSNLVSAEVNEDALNKRFIALIHTSLLAHTKTLESTNFDTVDKLGQQIETLNSNDNVVEALTTLIANLPLVYENIDHKLAPDLTWFLYSHNAMRSADAIVEYAKSNSDPYSLAKIQLQRAKYYFIIGDWAGALQTLKSVDAFSALSESDAHYSYLIQGVSLQRLKRHREALAYYEKVKDTSEFYSVALLNAALANIRQGWWTDAHILLKKAIEIEAKNGNTNFVDRLHLTHGFSLLQNEFYRDARDNFRSVGIDSALVHRAMLGIAIAAMHQKDFVAAIKMLTILKEKHANGVAIQEAYLLTPLVYEEMDQLRLAAASYNQAEAYFKSTSASLAAQSVSINANYILALVKETPPSLLAFTTPSVNTPQLDPLARLNIRLLDKLIPLEKEKSQRSKLSDLQARLLQNAVLTIKTQLEQQKQVSDSYLSQTRFSLANLYDK